MKKALFIVNSLSNGGAERVCVNMAEELLRQEFQVDFILLGKNEENERQYQMTEKFKIYDLEIKAKNKIGKLLKVFFAKSKINKIVKEEEKQEKYSLITSHLPMANVLTRFSKINRRAIYVFHTKMSSYDKKNSRLFKRMMQFLYGNRKIVAVSEGVKKEAIEKYGMKPCYITTIYNPIETGMMEEKKKEEIPLKERYLLQVGRFNKAKRQDRMIDIFKQGELDKDYKLVFLGTGELEEEAKKKVEKLNLTQRVIFMGWQENVYKWLANCEVLVCTSDFEAFPMNLIEAFACHTKVVSSNCKYGPNEILLGPYKEFLVEPNDIEGYIQKIKQAIKGYPEEPNEILEKCKPENIIEKYLTFMEK